MKCTQCSTQIRPVVAIDIDGTLAEYHNYFHVFAMKYLGSTARAMELMAHDLSEYPYDVEFSEWLQIPKHIYREIKLAYRQGGQKRMMPPLPGASTIVAACRQAGADVWVTTTRPYLRLDGIDPDTRFWLQVNKCDGYDGLLYDRDKYRLLAERVDPERIVGVVDDLPENIVQAHGLGMPTILKVNSHSTAAVRHGMPGNGQASSSLMNIRDTLVNRIKNWKDANDARE